MANLAQVQIESGVGTLVLETTKFSTGSDGYRGQGKVVDGGGNRYQVQVIAVRIGSKNGAESTESEKKVEKKAKVKK